MIDFYIPHKKNDEEIILLVRRHWLVLLKRMILWVIIGALPIMFYIFAGDTIESFVSGSIFEPAIIVLISVLYLFLWLFLFNGFIDYYLDVWIVTNYRILDIEQKQLFSRVVSEHELEKIQDITAEVHGILPTFLNYGEVYVQTAGQQLRFTFKGVPNPQDIKRKVISMTEYRKKIASHKHSQEKNVSR